MKIKIIRKLGMGNIQLKQEWEEIYIIKTFFKILTNHTNNTR